MKDKCSYGWELSPTGLVCPLQEGKRHERSSPSLEPREHVQTQQEGAAHKPGESCTRNAICQHLDLRLPSSRIVKNICCNILLCKYKSKTGSIKDSILIQTWSTLEALQEGWIASHVMPQKDVPPRLCDCKKKVTTRCIARPQ